MDQDWTPQRLLETSGNYWCAGALHAAASLDLFTVIGDQRLTTEAVASRIGSNPRATGMLLHALTALGLLAKDQETFANTPASALYLCRDSGDYLGHIIRHHHHLVESWARLDQTVRTGRPQHPPVPSGGDAERRESFLLGMFNLASQLAPVLVPQVELGSRRRLLDLGGGPGTYALYFCRQHPELQAVVFDLPATRPFAEKTIERFELTDRVSFQAGDYLHDPIQGSYDIVWLSHVLHGEGPQGCAHLLRQAASVLEPGGLLLVHEFLLNDDLAGPPFSTLFNLNMLLATESGQAYSTAQITTMLESAGLGEIRRLPLELPGETGVVAGVRRP
ncbi:MAG: methyltransferase domain-containing protein [Desulfuromonadales bacterium]|nr:methyltransferase domain-containing protein [Desulfuromonadales bacterium]